MKINISVFGRFHAYDLAKQLNDKGYLSKLITTYPKFKVQEWGIDKGKIESKIFYELLNRFLKKIKLSNDSINYFLKNTYTKSVISHLKDIDIFIGFSGQSLEIFKEAKKRNIITILERGSTHYDYRNLILNKEYEKFGLQNKINKNSRERELEEYSLADFISIPSNFVKNSFLEFNIPEKKLFINPYGVDLKTFYQVPKNDKIFRVLFVGETSFRKGLYYLVRAFSELNLPKSELLIVGNIKNDIKFFSSKYNSNKIKYLGPKPQKDLFKIYSSSNIFVMPSIEEGLALVQLQAMACGLPIICTPNTGGEDLLSENGNEGFVVPICDIESLKDKLFFLYNNLDICKKMGIEAKKRVKDNFQWYNYGERYLKNIHDIQ